MMFITATEHIGNGCNYVRSLLHMLCLLNNREQFKSTYILFCYILYSLLKYKANLICIEKIYIYKYALKLAVFCFEAN